MAASRNRKWRVWAERLDFDAQWGIAIGRYDGSEPRRTSISFGVDAPAKVVAAKLRQLADTIEDGMADGE